MPSVCIILLNYNGIEDTIACIESLKEITYTRYEIVIVDNASTDGSEGILKQRYSFPVIQTGKNLGFAGGNNAGIRYALENGADYIVLLNNDTVVDKGFLEPLVETAETYKNAGVVGGKIYYYDSTNTLWFYQGIEKMKYITLLNIVSKLIFTVSVFVVVRYSSDYIYVPFLYSLGSIVAGAIAIRVAIKNFGIVIKMPDKQYVIEQLKEGFHIFLSQVSVNFYKINNVFILGLFVEESIVGCFAIAKKLIDLTNQLAAVISHTVYPFINLKIEKSYNYIISFLKKLRAVIFVFTLIMGIVFLIFPDIIIHIVVGKPSSEAILCLRAMAFVPLIIGINVPAVQIILSYGKDRVYSLIVITGAVLNLALNLGLIPLFSYYGSCFAVIAAETFVTMSLYYAVYKMNLDKQPIQGATGVLPGSDAG